MTDTANRSAHHTCSHIDCTPNPSGRLVTYGPSRTSRPEKKGPRTGTTGETGRHVVTTISHFNAAAPSPSPCAPFPAPPLPVATYPSCNSTCCCYIDRCQLFQEQHSLPASKRDETHWATARGNLPSPPTRHTGWDATPQAHTSKTFDERTCARVGPCLHYQPRSRSARYGRQFTSHHTRAAQTTNVHVPYASQHSLPCHN